MNKRKLFYSLSPKFRFFVRRLYYFPTDSLNGILKRRHPLEPPKGLIYTGAGDFLLHGKKHLNYLITLADLKPSHRVLDIGSGIGRSAVALTSYLNSNGSYEGFDVIKLGVDWCKKKITTTFPNFHFTYVDLKNDLYRSTGDNAAKFIFPYKENEFDTILLMSVFTHMSLDEIDHYLKEINRVLKPNGKCLFTCFYFDEDTLKLMKERATDMLFEVDKEHYWLMDKNVTSANICIEKDHLKKMVEKNDLMLDKNVDGYWRNFNLKNENDYQDIWVIMKNK
ncbi:MAG: class I SAM-dependent methyltransferase [Bacteroidota bacterium]